MYTHDISKNILNQHKKHILSLNDVLVDAVPNPFETDSKDLVSLITKIVIPTNVTENILRVQDRRLMQT